MTTIPKFSPVAPPSASPVEAPDPSASTPERGAVPEPRSAWRAPEATRPSGPPRFSPVGGALGAEARGIVDTVVGMERSFAGPALRMDADAGALMGAARVLLGPQLRALEGGHRGLSAAEVAERQALARAVLGELAGRMADRPTLLAAMPPEFFAEPPPRPAYPERPRPRWDRSLPPELTQRIEANLARARARAAELKAEVAGAAAPSPASRMAGALLGSAVGDCIGSTVEFLPREEIRVRYGMNTDLIGGGQFRWRPGEPTDDTQMAVATLRSIVSRGRFDQGDVARHFVRWLESRPKDIGAMTARTLRGIQGGGSPAEVGRAAWAASGYDDAGNGSVMRAAPVVVLAALRSPAEQLELAKRTSEITHADPRCVYGVLALIHAMGLLLRGEGDLGARTAEHIGGACPSLAEAIAGAKSLREEDLRTSGYVNDTVQAAFWALENSTNFVDAILAVSNAGDDTDTAGATAGILLGAKFGREGIPATWRDALLAGPELEAAAPKLVALATKT